MKAKRIKKRKCRNCGEFFQPDYRDGDRRKYCRKDECKKRVRPPFKSPGWPSRRIEITSKGRKMSAVFNCGGKAAPAMANENPREAKKRYKMPA